MGSTKAEEFSLRDNRLAGYAKALAHPARIAILRILIQRNTCICGDIVDELPLSQSTVSQHIKELKSAGLIKGEVEGVKVCYCINDQAMQTLEEVFRELFTLYQSKPSECC